eukprot:TRINITY_DN1671_c0_g1_i1.p1 TRINITY_DN1671_c0_g1~~TRINITY_DN1671_c0_g1_i1.p1  ORF type:complete len:354 (-),score=60.51 TRINITY_DN1671_c0_g1_i1:38-1099(-)
MNLNDSKSGLLFVNFNQDATCLSFGSVEGFKVFNTQPSFSEAYSQDIGGVGICEMLFNSSLVALVGSGNDPQLSPRKLHILNTKNRTTICELSFVTPILAVKMNKKRLVVVMETKIHIYDISSIKILHTIDTVPNPKGLCALSPSGDNCYLAYPGSTEKGTIVIFDALSLQISNMIEAHKTPLSRMTINWSGNLIASSSNKGTVIRVHSITDEKKCYQFRRGTYPAVVYSIAFSFDSTLLVVSSETGTVHIFKVDQGVVSNISSEVHAYLPTMVADMWDVIPARSFATLKLPAGIENVCAINQNNSFLMVATGDGNFMYFGMDPRVGGELRLSKEHRLLPSREEINTPHLMNL